MNNIEFNQEILNQLNKIKIDVEFIKDRIENDSEDIELTNWAEKELERSRKISNNNAISHEKVKDMISKNEI